MSAYSITRPGADAEPRMWSSAFRASAACTTGSVVPVSPPGLGVVFMQVEPPSAGTSSKVQRMRMAGRIERFMRHDAWFGVDIRDSLRGRRVPERGLL